MRGSAGAASKAFAAYRTHSSHFAQGELNTFSGLSSIGGGMAGGIGGGMGGVGSAPTAGGLSLAQLQGLAVGGGGATTKGE